MRAAIIIIGAACVGATATPAHADLAGQVIDAETGAPLPGARVTVRGGATTTSDDDGRFTLPSPDDAQAIVVAAEAGHHHAWVDATGPRDDLMLALDALPADDPGAGFAAPTACAPCHPEQLADWQGSPMARAGTNTWVLDLYDGSGTTGGASGFVYARDSVHADANPASECAACHQPIAWAATPGVALAPVDDPDDAIVHGVSCDLCHRIAAIDVSRSNFPGIWTGVVSLVRSTSPVQLGVLGDAAYRAEQMRPSLQPQLSADVCAACHQDKNDPDGDGDFEEDNGVISEPTYLEWKASRFADPSSPDYATCASCHMPPRDDLTSACSVQDLAPRPPGQIRSHRIEGTTAEYLENAIHLEASAEIEDGELDVTVTITNDRTGHHVPTGVTVRNMILRVEALGPDGEPLAQTGGPVIEPLGGVGDPERGYWAGLAGRLYAKIPAAADGATPVFYTDATSLAEDDRIAAGASDTTSYRFALPRESSAVRVVARVVYRRAFRALIDTKAWTTDGHGRPLEDLVAPDFGHLMARVELAVDVPEPTPEGCGCRGAPGSPLALVVLVALALMRSARRRRARSTVRAR